MNISVRHTQYGDAAAIAAIYSQPLVYAATLQLPYPATAVWEKRLSESSDAGSHSLVALVDEEIVGHIYLAASPAVRRRHVATIGMGVSEDFLVRVSVLCCLLRRSIWPRIGWPLPELSWKCMPIINRRLACTENLAL